MGPLLTKTVHEQLHAAQQNGVPTVECSLDLERTTTIIAVNVDHWIWQGQSFPYLGTCNERTIYHWIDGSFQPVSRFTTALIKLVPTPWGPPTHNSPICL